MVQEVRIHAFCDWCYRRDQQETAAHGSISFAVGGRAKRYDYCDAHQNPDWAALLELATNDDGAAPARPRNGAKKKALTPATERLYQTASGDQYTCPVCGAIRRGRNGVLKHMVSFHEMDPVSASHRVPPRGGHSRECQLCSFLVADTSQGYAAHVIGTHGRKAWDKIKAKTAT